MTLHSRCADEPPFRGCQVSPHNQRFHDSGAPALLTSGASSLRFGVGVFAHFASPFAHFFEQGGDPTGTGRGGESIYGEKFEDEITRVRRAAASPLKRSPQPTLSTSCMRRS